MSDTQWPRFEVFEQERPDQPHRNTGAVHAPDAEMALQNARDVFARRPATVSLWVAPASQIYSNTAEELAANPLPPAGEPATGESGLQEFLIFQKLSHRQAETFVTHAGQVRARTADEALALALRQFDTGSVYVWWVVPAGALTRSEDEDAASMFAPAHDKPHRMPQQYQVQRLMREVAAERAAVAERAAATEQAASAARVAQ